MNATLDTLGPRDLCGLPQALWTLLGTLMGDEIHPRREALAGGEEGNGLELWRVLYLENEGGAMACHTQGVRGFHTFPKCSNLQDLNVHIGQWLHPGARYATDRPPHNLPRIRGRLLPHPRRPTVPRCLTLAR